MKSAHVLLASACLAGALLAQANDPVSQVKAWEHDFGNGWTVWWNGNLTPHRLFGPGARIDGQQVRNLVQARAAIASLLQKHGQWFGVGIADLREVVAAEGAVTLYLQYQQTWKGVPVHDAYIDFRFNTRDGGLSMAGSDARGNMPASVVPALTPIAAQNLFRVRNPGLVNLQGQPELEIYQAESGVDRLAWKVTGEIVGFESAPCHWFDAQNGDLLGTVETLHHADLRGTVKGNYSAGALPDIASNPPQLLPMPGVRVNVPGIGSATSDANGDFSILYAGTTPQNVTVSLAGNPLWSVTDQSATPILTASGVLDPLGAPTVLVFNTAPSEFVTAQTNGGRWAQAIHDYVKGIVPGMTQIDTLITVNVNLAQTCNAYFQGSSINFYRVGGGCNNTSYSSVVAHEYGHSIDSRVGGIRHSGLSEGFGDVCSIYLLDDNVIGRYFRTTGGPVRDATNGNIWPIVNQNSQEVHLQGQVIMGFSYDLLRRAQALYGTQPGYAIAESMMFESLLGNAGYYPDAVLEVCIADDTDSNLNNGTPHIDAIHNAALGRHFVRPVFQAIDIAHTPLADTAQLYGGYNVSATPTAKAGTITGMNLQYSVNGSLFTTLPMNASGGSFSATIPALGATGVVRYRLIASNDRGNTRRLPTEAADAFVFAVGQKAVQHSNNFDGGAAGYVTRAVTGTNNWRIGTPRGRNYDPPAAFSGLSCYSTDSGTGDTYSNSATMQLDSPAFSTLGFTGMRLRFHRWLNCDVSDVASVQVNGTNVYSADQQADQEWTTQDLDISALADNQASVVIRFQLATNNTSQAGGWNVDDVEVYSLSSPGCAVTSYGSASNCSGGAPALGSSGGAPQLGNGAFAFQLSLGTANSVVLWMQGVNAVSVPTPNGTLLVNPIVFNVGVTSGSGAATLPEGIPVDASLVGGTVYTQAGVFDGAAVAGFCLTNGVSATICGL